MSNFNIILRDCAGRTEIVPHQEAQANAQLIAAAPDLLAALEDMVARMDGSAKSCGHTYDCICTNGNARAAINKARGIS